MLKKALSFLIAMSLLTSTAVISAGATETAEKEETAVVKTIKPVIKNNITTYYDQDGNEVDITEDNREVKVDESKLPETYDLRDYGRSTSVKDQGADGFCWAFSSVASMESNILSNPELRAELGENAEQTLDLSEVGNAWYIHTSIDDESSYLYGDYYDDSTKGGAGSNPELAAWSLSCGFGAYPEEMFPYSDWGKMFPEQLRFYSDYRLKDFAILENDVDLIKQRLMDNGAMALAYVSHSSNYNMVDGMQTYYTNGSAIDPSASMPGGHGVTLVGWDDNFSRNNFCEEMRPENDGAWLCKNSWGVNNCSTAEGYEGYFWMSYESEIRDFSQFIMQSADEFDNIYQNQLALDCSVELISAANVFTAEKDEVLEQVCFSNIGAADITFEIYKLSEGYTSPTDGKLLTSFKDHVDYTGTHYIDVPEQVELGEGDMFSVVLKSDDVFNIYQKIEGPNALENKGFVMFSEDYWEDVTEEYLDNVGYMCIKALTSNKNGVVYKDELSQLIDEAENVSVDENVLQTSKDKFNTAIEKAKNVLNDSTVSQNTVDNTYCILNNEINEIKESVYEINSLDDFIDLQSKSEYGKYSNAYIILNTDLDFSDYEMQPSLFETDMYGGVFDGKGHTISNLKINSDCEVGLFSKLKNAEIRNLKLENCSFKSDELAGSIAGLAKNSLVTNCTVTNSKIVSKNNDAAGIVGLAEDTRIVNSSVKQSEIIGKTTATIIALLRGTEYAIDNCDSADNMTKSCWIIKGDDGSVVYNSTDSFKCSSLLVYKDGKYTFEPYLGTIIEVSSDEATLTKSGEKYDIDLNGNTNVYLKTSYEEYDEGYFYFEDDIETEEITLLRYYNVNYQDLSPINLVFPTDIGGLPVTSLGEDFRITRLTTVKSVTLPATIKNIAELDLSEFVEELETVTYGEGFTYINPYNFFKFSSLVTVNLPDSLERIENDAFFGCSNLENIRFGKNLKEIKYGAFSGCNKLQSIVLPDSVERVEGEAFAGCGSLSVVLGENIKEIGERAFGYTDKITQDSKFVKIPDFTVIGYAGTVAETYANENGFKFIDASTQDYEIPQGHFDYSVFLEGDVNLDGVVTIADATLIQKYLANKAELDQIQECNALLGDPYKGITINNATRIQKKIVGLDDIDDSVPKG